MALKNKSKSRKDNIFLERFLGKRLESKDLPPAITKQVEPNEREQRSRAIEQFLRSQNDCVEIKESDAITTATAAESEDDLSERSFRVTRQSSSAEGSSSQHARGSVRRPPQRVKSMDAESSSQHSRGTNRSPNCQLLAEGSCSQHSCGSDRRPPRRVKSMDAGSSSRHSPGKNRSLSRQASLAEGSSSQHSRGSVRRPPQRVKSMDAGSSSQHSRGTNRATPTRKPSFDVGSSSQHSRVGTYRATPTCKPSVDAGSSSHSRSSMRSLSRTSSLDLSSQHKRGTGWNRVMKQLNLKRGRSVSFETAPPSIRPTLRLKDYTDAEFRATFWDDDELGECMDKCRTIVGEMNNIHTKYCIRGLERLTDRGHLLHQMYKEEGFKAVLEARKPADIFDRYEKASEGCKQEALQLAHKDATSAERYLFLDAPIMRQKGLKPVTRPRKVLKRRGRP